MNAKLRNVGLTKDLKQEIMKSFKESKSYILLFLSTRDTVANLPIPILEPYKMYVMRVAYVFEQASIYVALLYTHLWSKLGRK